MFVPVPEAFNGSFRAEQHSVGRLHAVLTVIFTGLSLLSAAAACVVAAPAGWPACLGWTSLAMLVPALAGVCVIGLLDQDTGGLIVRLQHAVSEQLAVASQPWAVRRHPDEPVLQAFAGMVADGVMQLRRLQAGRWQMQARARDAGRALKASRDQAHQLGRALKEDGADLADAAAGIMMASARLVEDTDVTRESAESAESRVVDAVERAANLATATRATTAEITGMTRIAVSAAEAASSAHKSLAALDSTVEALSGTARQVSEGLHAAGLLRAVPDSGGGTAGRRDDVIAMAAAADGALMAMQAMLAELRTETGTANSRLSELAELIGRQHALGLALSYAVQQQGDDLAALVAHLMETHAGFATLRAGVAAVTRSGTARLAGAEALRGAADRLPGHAETIADILRIIPDFSSPLDF